MKLWTWVLRSLIVALLLIAVAFGGDSRSPSSSPAAATAPSIADSQTPIESPGGPGSLTTRPGHTRLLSGNGGGLIRLSTAARCPVQGDLEGRFTHSSQMGTYLQCILPAVEQWIDATYARMPHPRAYYLVPKGVTGIYGCRYNSTDLMYCLGPQSVLLGEDAVWEQYSQFGDGAPVVVLAHEVTHRFQHVVGMPLGAGAPNQEIRYENQADCGAGAFMNYARRKGYMNVQDDIKDLAGALAAAGQSEGPGRTHGTIAQRLQSFDRAYLNNSPTPLAACNAFVPEKPIIGG